MVVRMPIPQMETITIGESVEKLQTWRCQWECEMLQLLMKTARLFIRRLTQAIPEVWYQDLKEIASPSVNSSTNCAFKVFLNSQFTGKNTKYHGWMSKENGYYSMKRFYFGFLLLWSKHWPKATWGLGAYVLAHIHAGLQTTESQGGNSSKTGSWGRHWSRHGGVSAAHWLSSLLLHLLFSYPQGQLYRGSTDQCELDSPTSITNQIYAPRICLQAIPQMRFLLICQLCQVDRNQPAKVY